MLIPRLLFSYISTSIWYLQTFFKANKTLTSLKTKTTTSITQRRQFSLLFWNFEIMKSVFRMF